MKNLMIAALGVALFTAPVLAQGGGGQDRQRRPGGQGGFAGQQQRLSPEDAKAAWELQAQSVANELKLEDEPAGKLVAAYVDVRKAHGEGMRSLREDLMEEFRKRREEGGGGGFGGGRGGDAGSGARGRGGDARGGGGPGGAMRERMEKFNTKYRDSLKTKLGEFLPEEQVTTATTALGAFNPQWDQMTHSIAGFELDEFTQFVALDAVLDYLTVINKTRAGGNLETMRDTVMKAREELKNSLSEVISEEQMKQLARSFGGGRGRGGPGGGGG